MRFSIEWRRFVGDAKDPVRRYLEQLIESGENSIVLETMTARDVAGARSPERGIRKTPVAPTAAAPPMSDWRTALTESGAGPATSRSGAPPTATDRAGKPGGPATADSQTPLPPLESLEAIAKAVAGCTRCSLYSTATNPVPGEGNPNADFMVVGEAPGATEDETGRPFVGRAGQLLTQILAAIQLSRDDVFICNVLKHRPPGNRNPEPAEVIACSPYLIRQIELVRPKVILALGTFSAQTLLATKTSIGKLRGQIHEYHGVPVVVTYHPAALLRNPAWKRPTWEDVQLARRILDSAVPGA